MRVSCKFRSMLAIALQVLAEEITPTLKKLKEVTFLHGYPNHVVFTPNAKCAITIACFSRS